MAAVTSPQPRSLIGMAVSAWAGRRGRRPGLGQLAAKVREHIPTVTMLTLIDVGAFHIPGAWGMTAGLVVTGLSVGVLDFAWTGR